MTRYTIAYEARPTVDGRLIAGGALIWTEDPIPLLRAPDPQREGHDGSRLVGVVLSIRREEDQSITAELHDLTDGEIHGVAAEIDLDSVSVREGHIAEDLVILEGRIRAVTLGARPAWPGTFIP